MGQQQLLLVILVTIIVGIATVVAINIFGTAADQANRDAVRQDLVGAAANIQGIWARPELMGGAGRNFQGNITLAQITERIGIPGNTVTDDGEPVPGTIENENGRYVISVEGERSIEIVATPASGEPTMTITVTHTDADGWSINLVDGADS